jgi:hypothetical protein
VAGLALFAAGTANAAPVPFSPPTLGAVETHTFSDGTCDSKAACWVCDGPVNLGEVDVVVDTQVARVDAVHFEPGCSGYIGRLNITTYSADGVKVAEGAHDITVDSGSISCLAKLPTLHQDGIQVMGGDHLHFNGMTIMCGRATDNLIDSEVFVNMAGQSTRPPDDVVFDWCVLGPGTAHTVNLEDSTDSGVRDSTIYAGKFPNLTFTVGSGAVNPIDQGNTRLP